MKLFNFFFPKTLEKVRSSINGEIEVVEQFGRKSIRVGGMEESGPMVEGLWRKGIKEIKKLRNLEIKGCLILGLGGGSAVKLVNKYYPKAKILGVEIDLIMVDLGKKYLGLGKYRNLEIKIANAIDLNNIYYLSRFDLVLVDLYLGKDVPQEIESKEFLRSVKEYLAGGGIVIFNRLRGRGKDEELDLFFKKLQKIFNSVKMVDPLINRLFICGK